MSNPTKILSIAKAEVGTHEKYADGHWVNGSKYNIWYGKIPGYGTDGLDYPWCAVYVAWCADKAGIASLYPKTAGCETAVAWYRKKGRFSEYPAIGAQFFLGAGGGTHTGIVYDYDASYIYTYEGNTNTSGSAEGDGVYAKKRTRASVYGYGYPEFSEGIKSADPKYADQAPKAAPAPVKTPAKPAASKLVALNAAVKPGATHAQVKDLQHFLVKAGYGPIPGAYSTFYGPETQKAVARFHNKNPQFRTAGVSYDPKIGPSGFKELQKEAGVK
ncbi:CHAP domain-containing protein [Streptomyces sp. NPDC046805]|uniref:C40 family peptidase n=1 Tax=Streptomyces sp. NPDC046805 TaxID=3155134 RepID=UPI0033D7E942